MSFDRLVWFTLALLLRERKAGSRGYEVLTVGAGLRRGDNSGVQMTQSGSTITYGPAKPKALLQEHVAV